MSVSEACLGGVTGPSARRRVTSLGLVLALVLMSCSDGAESQLPTPEPATSGQPTAERPESSEVPEASEVVATRTTGPAPIVLDYQIAASSGEVIEVEATPAGPATFAEIVDLGIEDGRWSEVEGLSLVLGAVLGAVPEEQVPGLRDVSSGELSRVLHRANTLAMSGGHSEAELAELRRWYEVVVPPVGLLESAAPSTANAGFRHPEPQSAMSSPTKCRPIDATDFDDWAVIAGCYRMLEEVVAGVQLRVFYPAYYDDDPTLASLPLLALESLATSTEVFSPLATVDDVDLVFSLVDTLESGEGDTMAVATSNAQWGTASIDGACPISVFPLAFRGDDRFQQTVAHEVWHCVQHHSGYEVFAPEGAAWYSEGGAEFFSNVAYPTVNDEHRRLDDFDQASRTTALYDMTYEAWIWWQFLSNRTSPAAVATLQAEMDRAKDGGRAAMAGYGEVFERFVLEYVAGAIVDQGGGQLASPRWINGPLRSVDKNGAGTMLEFETGPFVAARFAVDYARELDVDQSDATVTVGTFAMTPWAKRRDPGAWTGVTPGVRSCGPVRYMVVATTESPRHTARISVDQVEQAKCDRCLVGTWTLDLDTFETMIVLAMAAQGGLPPGLDLAISGAYDVTFGDDGSVSELRDGLTIGTTVQGFTVEWVIDGYAEGRYTADGERLLLEDVVDVFVEVTVTGLPGADGSTLAQDASVLGGVGTYTCTGDELSVSFEGFDSLRLLRVDRSSAPPGPPTT